MSLTHPRKKIQVDAQNCLSDLPESVITHILSCLPTKDAVRTSVLARDWEYKWTSIYKIKIDDKDRFSTGVTTYKTKRSFLNFVDRVLLVPNHPTIKRFILSCREKYDSSRIATWISAVLMRHVETMYLYYMHEGILFPRCLWECESLRLLIVISPCTVRVPNSTYLHHLKVLVLCRVKIMNAVSDSERRLMISLPALKSLHLRRCKWLDVKFVEIDAPKLLILKCQTKSHAGLSDYSIKIFGAKLRKFESLGGLPENFIFSGCSVACVDLANADGIGDLQLLGRCGLQVRGLMKGFSRLKDLKVSRSMVKALTQSKSGLHLPKFDKLTELEVSSSGDFETILELLHAAPSLIYLVLDVCFLDDYDFDGVESVPSCIESRLKEVEFKSFHCTATQFSLAKFIFKNAVKLEAFFVDGYSSASMSKREFVEQLEAFPKVSTCLTIMVS